MNRGLPEFGAFGVSRELRVDRGSTGVSTGPYYVSNFFVGVTVLRRKPADFVRLPGDNETE